MHIWDIMVGVTGIGLMLVTVVPRGRPLVERVGWALVGGGMLLGVAGELPMAAGVGHAVLTAGGIASTAGGLLILWSVLRGLNGPR
jgi:hypothetical protein